MFTPSEPEMEVESIEWGKADWPVTTIEQVKSASWNSFAAAPFENPHDAEACLATEDPGAGHWANTPIIEFGGGIQAMLAQPQESAQLELQFGDPAPCSAENEPVSSKVDKNTGNARWVGEFNTLQVVPDLPARHISGRSLATTFMSTC